MKKGVIFSSGGIGQEIRVGKKITILKLAAKWGGRLGLVIMLTGIVGTGFVVWPMLRAEARYLTQQKNEVVIGDPKTFPEWSNTEGREAGEAAKWVVPDGNYSVFVEKIGAVSAVTPDVNAGDFDEYSRALKKGVAEAAGLSHPGKIGTTYLFAHSVGSRADYARYNAIFYLLHRIGEGDRVEVVYRGKLYKYEVIRKEILGAKDVRYLIPQKEKELLVLSTCYPPGTSWKRLVVVAERY